MPGYFFSPPGVTKLAWSSTDFGRHVLYTLRSTPFFFSLQLLFANFTRSYGFLLFFFLSEIRVIVTGGGGGKQLSTMWILLMLLKMSFFSYFSFKKCCHLITDLFCKCRKKKKMRKLVLSEVGQRPVGDLSILGGVWIKSLCQRLSATCQYRPLPEHQKLQPFQPTPSI